MLTRLPATRSQLRKAPSPFRAALGGVSEGPLVASDGDVPAGSGWSVGRGASGAQRCDQPGPGGGEKPTGWHHRAMVGRVARPWGLVLSEAVSQAGAGPACLAPAWWLVGEVCRAGAGGEWGWAAELGCKGSASVGQTPWTVRALVDARPWPDLCSYEGVQESLSSTPPPHPDPPGLEQELWGRPGAGPEPQAPLAHLCLAGPARWAPTQRQGWAGSGCSDHVPYPQGEASVPSTEVRGCCPRSPALGRVLHGWGGGDTPQAPGLSYFPPFITHLSRAASEWRALLLHAVAISPLLCRALPSSLGWAACPVAGGGRWGSREAVPRPVLASSCTAGGETEAWDNHAVEKGH